MVTTYVSRMFSVFPRIVARSWVHRECAVRTMLAVIAGMLLVIGPPLMATAQDGPGAVYVIDISGEIDLGLAPYLERVLDEAADNEASAVLVEIDTPGGRLDAVLQMQKALLGSEIQTIAFVDRTAFSAGALVAIASELIYMAPGSVMGAATPIDGATGETASEKVISAVTATFGSTAEDRGRDPVVAEAMVDPEIEIDGLVEEGKLLTLTATEAEQWGYTEGILETREDVLAEVGLTDAEVVETSPSFAENIVRFLTNPLIASLLVLGGMFLIIGDLFVEGIGIGTAIGVLLLGIFFYGHLLAGLAGWEDVLLVVLGLVLLGVEFFVIPGFGVFGLAGIAALLVGIYLALADRDVRTPEQSDDALLAMGIIAVGLLAGLVAMVWLVPKSDKFGRLVLTTDVGDLSMPEPQEKPRGWLKWFGGNPRESEVHTENLELSEQVDEVSIVSESQQTYTENEISGTALSDLRPAGIASINGLRVDVVTEGDYINAGTRIVVVADEGYRRVVKRAEE